MKVLLLADAMENGGAETHILTLAEGLLARGHRVTLVTSGGRLADRLASEGVSVQGLPHSLRGLGELWSLSRWLSRLVRKEGIEILHAHTRRTALLLRAVGAVAGRVVTVHAAFRAGGMRTRLSYWGDRTVAISEDLRVYAADTYRIPCERISVIRNGIDLSHFFSPPWEEKEKESVVFVSRMDRDCAEGARLLCRVAPRLARSFPALRIELCGGGEAYPEIATLAAEANRRIGREVILAHGDVEDPASILRRTSIFVGVSRAAMEGAASGCAVILCGDEGYGGVWSPERAKPLESANLSGRGGRFPDEHGLEGDLWRLLSDNVLCQELGAFARGRCTSLFSAEEMCCRTEEVYRSLLAPAPRRRVLIGGYAGCGNLGDDAMLLGTVRELQRISPPTAVAALTGVPRISARRFGIECYQRRSPFAIAGAMARADAFLSGGGTLLQNLTGDPSLSYYLFLLRLGARFGCRTALFSAGIGPVLGESAERRVRETLGGVDRFYLREEEARRTLCGMGISPGHISVGADAAFLLPPPPPERGEFLLREAGISSERPLLAVALRPCETRETIPVLLTSVRHLSRQLGLLPVLLAFDRFEDVRISTVAAREVEGVLLPLREPSDAVAILSCASLAVVMRLHAMILSTVAGIPALGVPAEGKLGIFARTLGQSALSGEGLSAPVVCDALMKEWLAREHSRPRLLATAEEQRKKAVKDLEKLVDLIYNKGNEEFRADPGAGEETLL